MQKKFGLIMVVAFCCLLAAPAHSDLLRYSFTDVAFTNIKNLGFFSNLGTATGSFIYDTDLATLSDVSITTTAASVTVGGY